MWYSSKIQINFATKQDLGKCTSIDDRSSMLMLMMPRTKKAWMTSCSLWLPARARPGSFHLSAIIYIYLYPNNNQCVAMLILYLYPVPYAITKPSFWRTSDATCNHACGIPLLIKHLSYLVNEFRATDVLYYSQPTTAVDTGGQYPSGMYPLPTWTITRTHNLQHKHRIFIHALSLSRILRPKRSGRRFISNDMRQWPSGRSNGTSVRGRYTAPRKTYAKSPTLLASIGRPYIFAYDRLHFSKHR